MQIDNYVGLIVSSNYRMYMYILYICLHPKRAYLAFTVSALHLLRSQSRRNRGLSGFKSPNTPPPGWKQNPLLQKAKDYYFTLLIFRTSYAPRSGLWQKQLKVIASFNQSGFAPAHRNLRPHIATRNLRSHIASHAFLILFSATYLSNMKENFRIFKKMYNKWAEL